MFSKQRQRIYIKISALCILLAFLIFLINSSPMTSSGKTKRETSTQPLVVSVQPQPTSPIRLSAIVSDASNQLEPKVSYVVSNVSGKPINAYAIRHIAIFGNASSEGVIFRNSNSINSVLREGQSEPASLEGDTYSEPVRTIKLIVDYVEFIDGTTWGEDKFRSAERLAGQRAGAQAEVDRLRSLSKEKDTTALISAIEATSADILPPPGHASGWNDGFREGVGFKHGRLQRANRQGGLREIENELQQPFDASERKQ